MELDVVARKWGSSLGIIIPSEVVEAEGIKENKKIRIEIKKEKVKAGELWGKFKNWGKSTQELKNEMRRGWD